MKDLKTGVTAATRKYFFLVASALFIILFFMAVGAAVNIDEGLHNGQARKVVNWFLTLGADRSCFDTPTSNLKYYGQSPDNIAAFINRIFSIENESLTRHITGFVFASLLILVTGLLAYRVTRKYFAGIAAMALLFFTPPVMGQAFGNLKDIPFAFGYTWSLLVMARLFSELPVIRWKTILTLAFAFAFTNSVRIGGLVLFPYLGLFLLAWLLLNYKEQNKILKQPDFWKKLVTKGIIIVAIGYFAGLVFWPYGLENPLKNPAEALSVMEHYKISIRQIFEGNVSWSTDLPWYYLPKWLLISVPEVVWLGLILFIALVLPGLKKGSGTTFFFAIVGFALVFPVVYVIAIKSNLYSGWRQMYFIYPSLLVLSAAGITRLFEKLKGKSFFAGIVVFAGLLAMPALHILKTYPSEYIYFNSFAGFNKKAWSNYEYDYYWHDMKKAANWLQNETGNSGKQITVASNFDLSPYFYGNKNIQFRYVHFYDKISTDWDYAILGNNYVHPYQLKKNNWQPANVVETFYHKGNPTIIVLKGQDKNARLGYKAFQQENYREAAEKLGKAAENDKNDLNLLTSLGESYLALGDFEKSLTVSGNGLEINPFYEPLKLIQAKIAIKQENYREGLCVLESIVKENPRYYKVVPYLILCYEKTGKYEQAEKFKRINHINLKNQEK